MATESNQILDDELHFLPNYKILVTDIYDHIAKLDKRIHKCALSAWQFLISSAILSASVTLLLALSKFLVEWQELLQVAALVTSAGLSVSLSILQRLDPEDAWMQSNKTRNDLLDLADDLKHWRAQNPDEIYVPRIFYIRFKNILSTRNANWHKSLGNRTQKSNS